MMILRDQMNVTSRSPEGLRYMRRW